jgi:hypothetical protein
MSAMRGARERAQSHVLLGTIRAEASLFSHLLFVLEPVRPEAVLNSTR